MMKKSWNFLKNYVFHAPFSMKVPLSNIICHCSLELCVGGKNLCFHLHLDTSYSECIYIRYKLQDFRSSDFESAFCNYHESAVLKWAQVFIARLNSLVISRVFS